MWGRWTRGLTWGLRRGAVSDMTVDDAHELVRTTSVQDLIAVEECEEFDAAAELLSSEVKRLRADILDREAQLQALRDWLEPMFDEDVVVVGEVREMVK